jgi:hypothetical protein
MDLPFVLALDAKRLGLVDFVGDAPVADGTRDEIETCRNIIRWICRLEAMVPGQAYQNLKPKLEEAYERTLELSRMVFMENGNQWLTPNQLWFKIKEKEPDFYAYDFKKRCREIRLSGHFERKYEPRHGGGRVVFYRLSLDELLPIRRESH